jgi:hypothetical protein
LCLAVVVAAQNALFNFNQVLLLVSETLSFPRIDYSSTNLTFHVFQEKTTHQSKKATTFNHHKNEDVTYLSVEDTKLRNQHMIHTTTKRSIMLQHDLFRF